LFVNKKLSHHLQKEKRYDRSFAKPCFHQAMQGFVFLQLPIPINQRKTRGPMADFSLEEVFSLLGTQHIKGSEKELKRLCIRIAELVALNGEDWVKESRQTLLDEWEYIVNHGIIG